MPLYFSIVADDESRSEILPQSNWELPYAFFLALDSVFAELKVRTQTDLDFWGGAEYSGENLEAAIEVFEKYSKDVSFLEDEVEVRTAFRVREDGSSEEVLCTVTKTEMEVVLGKLLELAKTAYEEGAVLVADAE